MSEFARYPSVRVDGAFDVSVGWQSIGEGIKKRLSGSGKKRSVVVVEFYQGVLEDQITPALSACLCPERLIPARDCMWPEERVQGLVFPDVTDDRVFGRMTGLDLDAWFDQEKIARARWEIEATPEGLVLVVGTGAALVAGTWDLLVYADMARWEIQLRMREHLVDNIGVRNRAIDDWMLLYKQGYFVDWRVCDRLKKQLMPKWDFLLDTNDRRTPKMIPGEAALEGFRQTLRRPFSVVPFFDPGPWGGQWMKEHCNLDPAVQNYAWCFNCVPEENSLLLEFRQATIELPSIDLVFFDPLGLLGRFIVDRFGEEFPIRFDYLDTFDGGNLSLQVHPLTSYIREKFGVTYTQDESYYMLDARPGAVVYLGLREGIDPAGMIRELEAAQQGDVGFDAERYIQTWPVKKHDHFLIPGGTVHCSGKDSLVLEISATPYIFTFKLWDWGRLGLDGRPRPINIEHGKNVIQWDRTTAWTRKNLVNRFETVARGEGWREERTGLHELEFIETRRHWFRGLVSHETRGTVHVLNVVEGDEVVVESPSGAFSPFVVHYAETFIVPAGVGAYTIRPHGKGRGKECATIKAYVREEA